MLTGCPLNLKPAIYFDVVTHLHPEWYAAAAGAAGAGALLMPNHRLLAGGLGAALVLALAIKQHAPCCQECAEHKPCAGAEPLPPLPVDAPSGLDNGIKANVVPAGCGGGC